MNLWLSITMLCAATVTRTDRRGRPLFYYLDNNVTLFSAAIPRPRSTDRLTVG